MIEYYENLPQSEQEEITEVIQVLQEQTFILDQKYDRKGGRMKPNRLYRTAYKHLEFLKSYFSIAGIYVEDNSHLGTISIQTEMICGDKLPRLATIYILVLKLIYDEQMSAASNQNYIGTTLGMLNGKMGEFRLLDTIPSITEMRRAIALLKRYQMVEPLDVLEDMNEQTRIVIYPCINLVILGDDVRALLATYEKEDNDGSTDEYAGIQGSFTDVSE